MVLTLRMQHVPSHLKSGPTYGDIMIWSPNDAKELMRLEEHSDEDRPEEAEAVDIRPQMIYLLALFKHYNRQTVSSAKSQPTSICANKPSHLCPTMTHRMLATVLDSPLMAANRHDSTLLLAMGRGRYPNSPLCHVESLAHPVPIQHTTLTLLKPIRRSTTMLTHAA